VLLEMVWQ